jgi:hypothetical protein
MKFSLVGLALTVDGQQDLAELLALLVQQATMHFDCRRNADGIKQVCVVLVGDLFDRKLRDRTQFYTSSHSERS